MDFKSMVAIEFADWKAFGLAKSLLHFEGSELTIWERSGRIGDFEIILSKEDSVTAGLIWIAFNESGISRKLFWTETVIQ